MTKTTKKLTKRQIEQQARRRERREQEKKVNEMETALITKYGVQKVKAFKSKYDKAHEMLMDGDIVAEYESEKIAEKEYINEAERIMASIPEDYKEFREFLMEIW